jgi:tetratricopeptide (TPR) repeat protein
MFAFSRRFWYALSNKLRRHLQRSSPRKNQENSPEEKWIIDFTKPGKSPFNIKSESSYNAYLSNGSLELCLKKTNCIAWVETPDHEYQDHIIEAKIRLDSGGGYASAGLMFHLADNSYYLALVSSKGYFRLDVIKDNAPRTLIAWTEIHDFNGTNINLNVITYSSYFVFLVNGRWAGEVNDDSISGGQLGFVLASYEATSYEATSYEAPEASEYACKAWLDYFSVDTRAKSIEESYVKWSDDANINADSRLRLAETFAVMGESTQSLEQINKAWKRREDAARSVSATYTEIRTRKELLLAARMSFRLKQYREAEEFIGAILDQGKDSAEGKEAVKEKIKILNELSRFAELKRFMLANKKTLNKDVDFHTLLARCHWNLKEYEKSAAAWDKAFSMDSENGVYAANMANALELAGKKDEALAALLAAGKIFLRQDNQAELAVMIPKLVLLGEENHEARALAGKWAFSVEDYDRCEAEFTAAERIRRGMKPMPEADPALCYLWGLVFSIKGQKKEAIRLLKEAVRLAPDYEIFSAKLAELKAPIATKSPAQSKGINADN